MNNCPFLYPDFFQTLIHYIQDPADLQSLERTCKFFKQIIKKYIPLDIAEQLLFAALKKHSIETAIRLIQDFDFNLPILNYTLAWGIICNSPILIQLTISKGADILSDSFFLIHTVHLKHFDLVPLLISLGADIHTNDDQILFDLITEYQLDLVKLILKSGANIHAQNKRILLHAVRVAQNEAHLLNILEILLQYAVDIHNEEALVLACNREYSEVINLLLRHGADGSRIYACRHNSCSHLYN